MEFGDAITDKALQHAIELTQRSRASGEESLSTAATNAVALAYCICVTDGEDAAEHRFSDVHRNLITEVVNRVLLLERASSAGNGE